MGRRVWALSLGLRLLLFLMKSRAHTTLSALDTTGDNTHGQVQKKRREKKKEKK
jgi:hypothetical protein